MDKSIEAFLRSMQGVLSARVARAADGSPQEIHLLIDERNHPPTSRDVQSALLTKFQLDLPADRVSLIRNGGMENIEDGMGRFHLIGVNSGFLAGEMTAEVHMSWNDRLSVGRSTGVASPKTRLKLVAEATIAAIDDAVGMPVGIRLLDVSNISLAGHPCVASLVGLRRGSRLLRLVGTALVDENPDRATARSVLDAVNRNLDHYELIQEVEERWNRRSGAAGYP